MKRYLHNSLKILILSVGLMFCFLQNGWGQILTFEFSALAGDEANTTSNYNDINLGVSTISRGSGVTAGPNAQRFNSLNWTTAASVDASDYVEFSITPNAGYQFSISSIYMQHQRSGTGPVSFVLRSSLDSYSSNLGGIHTISDVTTTQNYTFTFSQTNNTSVISYRIYAYSAEAGTGTWGPGDGTGDDIIVNGTVTAIGCSAPTITSQPFNSTKCVGQSATFSVVATCSSGSLSYQWRKNGTNISGATSSSYTIPSVAIGDAGNYDVVVTCVCGSNPTTNSSSATLTVNALPSDPSGTITPAANPACTSTTLSYSAPNANIYWQTSSTGTSTANPTTSAYTVSTSGTYYVRAYNGNCWSTNSVASAAITINPVPTISGITNVWVGYTTTLTGNPVGGSWSSSNTSIATVDASGEVLGIAPGTATITYTLSGCSGNTNVTVTSAPCLSTDFNSGSTPSGWLNNSVIFNTNGSCTSTNQAAYNAVGDYLVTSAINNPSSVYFTYRRSSNTTAWSLLVQIGSTSTGPWTDVQTISGATEACQTANIDLSAWSSMSGLYLKLIDTRGSGTNERYIDDLNVICSSSNTISTGTVSTSPFNVTCSSGASGTVTFTSTGTFSSNTYTVQLSSSTGSFTSPTNIGTLISDANSGTINFTIPAGTISGSGYKIRVISSSPVVFGSHSATFTISLTGTCTAFEIESILIDACDGGTGLEGVNEMVRFQVGSSDLNTSDLNVSWPNAANPWRGICQNSGTAATVAAINATITGGGMLIEPTGGVLPANAQVMFFTSESFDYTLFDFTTLNYNIYAIFQCAGNTAGHFVNHSSTNPTNRTLTMTFTGHGTDAVTYNAYYVFDGDGGAVDFTPAGVQTYGSTGGCVAPMVPLPIELSKFSGKLIDKRIQLTWQTISEINNDFFEIHKSRDLVTYDKIGLVVGAGNSNSTLSYSFIDENPFNGNNYYKLKQFDFDGKSSESKIIVVNVNQNSLVNIYVSDNNTLNIKSNNSRIEQIEILDVTGKQIYFKQNFSDNDIIQFNVPNISQGIYFVKIIGNNFSETRKIYFQ